MNIGWMMEVKTFVFVLQDFNYSTAEFQWSPNLILTRIYFDTPVIDQVTRDSSSKFVDKLAIIGGTFGLFTGFSIISGVEILYFASKFLMKVFNFGEKKSP